MRHFNIAMLSVHSCPVGELGTKDTGGMSVYIRELARELGMRGHRVDIFTRFHDLRDRQIIDLGHNVRLIHIRAGDIANMHKLDIYPHLADFTRALEDFRKNEGREYDLVHSHYWLSGRVGRWLQLQWDVPHVMMFHTLGEVKNAIGVGEVEPVLRLNTERGVVKNCHRIIAATEREKGELIQYYDASPDTIGVVPCGVNLALFRPSDKRAARAQIGLEQEKNIILYVGRMDPLKGIDRLFKAGAYLKDRIGLKLVIVGDNDHQQPEFQRLKWFSEDLGIQDLIVFAGRVEQEKLPLYYSASDVSIVPSHHESFGLVALESLACGTPVIATRVGGIGSMIRNGLNGYIVEEDVPRNIADRIMSLLSGLRTGQFAADEITNSVNSFSWSNVADTLIDEYRQMLNDPIAKAA